LENINIPGTDNSPEVVFDFAANSYDLRGMSYMEDASRFYEPILSTLRAYVETLDGSKIRFGFSLSYFNSTSSRIVMSLFNMLEDAAERGNSVTIEWYHEDDEDIVEQGEEFGEDLQHAKFKIINIINT
jgi:hypothetical protein